MHVRLVKHEANEFTDSIFVPQDGKIAFVLKSASNTIFGVCIKCKNTVVRVLFLQNTVTYRVGNMQRECSFTFCGVLQVQKHCSARVISSMIFFSTVRVC